MEIENESKSLDELNYTISNSVYNLASSANNFLTTPSCNYTCNISSKMNDAILLSESFFMIEYTITTGSNPAVLIPNWFLSMLNSINFNINAYSFQLNSISPGKTFPMLVQTMRYMQYEQSDFSKYSKVQQEYFQNFNIVNNAVPSQEFNQMDAFRPSIFSPSRTFKAVVVLNLRDLLPVIDTVNQCSGLLSFSFVLNYNQEIHSLNKAPTSFIINKINFHYPVKTYNSEQVLDVDINYLKTIGILQGRHPQTQNINIAAAAFGSIASSKTDVVVSNIQLSTNQIFKLLIFPVFTYKDSYTAGFIEKYSQDGNWTSINVINEMKYLGADDYDITENNRNNYKRSLSYLLTPTGGVGSPLFGITNLKVVVNGNQVEPSNITPLYETAYNSDYYQYFYGFDQAPINRYTKPNLFFNYDMYQNFSPIIVDISNATSKNAYNSLTFSYTVFNKFTMQPGSAFTANVNLDTFYTVLNLQVLND